MPIWMAIQKRFLLHIPSHFNRSSILHSPYHTFLYFSNFFNYHTFILYLKHYFSAFSPFFSTLLKPSFFSILLYPSTRATTGAAQAAVMAGGRGQAPGVGVATRRRGCEQRSGGGGGRSPGSDRWSGGTRGGVAGGAAAARRWGHGRRSGGTAAGSLTVARRRSGGAGCGRRRCFFSDNLPSPDPVAQAQQQAGLGLSNKAYDCVPVRAQSSSTLTAIVFFPANENGVMRMEKGLDSRANKDEAGGFLISLNADDPLHGKSVTSCISID
uniref:Uncharacterized protein n=1 Tax=Oryza meridionalis TaxID=40149 RepID=A0A0E0FA12_9ORYZ